MEKFKQKLSINLALTSLTIIALLAPDLIAQIFTENNQATFSGKFILGLFLFSFALSFSQNRFAFIVLGFFMLLELIQFCNLFYYGTLITSEKFRLLFEEFDEVFITAKEAAKFLFFVPLIVILPYLSLIITFSKLEHLRLKLKTSIIIVCLLLAIIPYRIHVAYNGPNYYPDPSDHSLRNTLYAFTNFIYNHYSPKLALDLKYKDYKIKPLYEEADNMNVILIIGESVNYNHMSLFGYKRQTNPLLSSLKNDPNFKYFRGISSGVSTPVSIPTLINNIYEPNNLKELEKRSANLFRLAKKHRFKTFYISAQSGALLTNLGAEYIDHKIFRNKELILFNQYQDEALLKLIPELEYARENFIVINQRNAHAPYQENYQHNPKFNHFVSDSINYRQFRIDSYDNAMLYNDYLIYEMIKFFKNKFSGPTYIFFTSDHGEVLDSSKVAFGHAELKKEVAEVPFLAYISNTDPNKINFPKEPISHYEIGILISRILGFEIHNPNLKEGTFYINGTEMNGHNEYIEYHK